MYRGNSDGGTPDPVKRIGGIVHYHACELPKLSPPKFWSV